MSLSAPAEPQRTLRADLLLAASLALAASALEFVVHLIQLARHRPVYQGMDVLWAKPLTNVVMFMAAAVLLRLLPRRVSVFLLCFAAVAAPLLLLRPGSPVPLLILAAGIASRAVPFLERPGRTAALVRVGGILAPLFIIISSAGAATRAYRERTPSPDVTAPAGSPNVLLIILDTVRAASMSLWGGRAETPNIDALAATGVLFERAVSPAPWTLPAHASLFTGLWPHEHGADWRTALDGRAPTLAEVLGGDGYRTGGFAANLIYTSREHGLDRGFQVYRDYKRSPGAIIRSTSLGQLLSTATIVRRVTGYHDVAGRKSAPEVNREFLDWQRDNGDRPWFAFLNYFDAHSPYLPRAPYAGRYSAGLPPRRFDQHRYWSVEGGIGNWAALSPDEVEAERAAYEEAITELDKDIGALIDTLRSRGALDRTLIIVTSDHGELFGEHDTHSHGNSLFWRSVHVPLVMAWPGRLPAGRRVPDAVSLRDLPSTILDLSVPQTSTRLAGTSLAPLFNASAAATTLTLTEVSVEQFSADDPPMRNGSLQSLIGPGWQYTRAANGNEDVYRITGDWTDTLISDATIRAALVDSARARLSKVPAPSPVTRR